MGRSSFRSSCQLKSKPGKVLGDSALSWIVTRLLRWRQWHGDCDWRIRRKQKRTIEGLAPTITTFAAKPTSRDAPSTGALHVSVRAISQPFQCFNHNHEREAAPWNHIVTVDIWKSLLAFPGTIWSSWNQRLTSYCGPHDRRASSAADGRMWTESSNPSGTLSPDWLVSPGRITGTPSWAAPRRTRSHTGNCTTRWLDYRPPASQGQRRLVWRVSSLRLSRL